MVVNLAAQAGVRYSIENANYRNCKSDFTYIDDIVDGIIKVMKKAPEKKNGEDGLKEFARWYKVFLYA